MLQKDTLNRTSIRHRRRFENKLFYVFSVRFRAYNQLIICFVNVGGECCEDKYLIDPNLSCCERESYKISEKTCCPRLQNDPTAPQYNITNIPYGKCCDDVAYDPQSQSCKSMEGVLKVIEGGKHIFITIIPRYLHWFNECVNITVWTYSVDASFPRCGSKPYDNSSHGCCIRGKPLIYEHLFQICKNGRLYNKSSPSHNEICLFGERFHQLAMSYSSDDEVN